MDEKLRLDNWLRRRDGAGKRRTRADGGMTRRQQKRQPHVEREEKRNEMGDYYENYQLWYEANKSLITELAAAYRARKESPANYARYEELQDRLRATNCPEQPGEDNYRRPAESPAFWRSIQRIRDGRASDNALLLDFLKRDPWFFGSGYLKEDICRILKRAELLETEKREIREVILQVAASPWARREFVEYARLAATLGTPEFRAALEKIEGWKARLVLDRLDQADRMRASREAKETSS